MSLHSSSSVNGEGSTPKDPLYKILDELRSLKLWKEKQERKEKGKKGVEEISQDERKKIREEERRKIMKEMKREKHVSYSSHNSCKSLSEELRDYYEGRHRSHLRPHSHRRENGRKPQEVNIKLSYFHGKDNVEANLDWEIRVEQQLKRKSTSKSYGSHSYPKKDQGQGILGVRPSKPKDDKGKTIEKQPLKASIQEKTSSMKCFKCLGRGHITSQCPTKKTMIMRGQDIYSSQDEATTSPSSSESEEAKGGKSSEEIYPQEEGQPLMVKEECKEVSVSSKRLAKKERHFEIKTNIKEISLPRQPPHFLFCKKTLVSIATSLRLEFIPQVKELLDDGLVRKRLNPCALLVPKIGAHMGHLSDQGVPTDPKRIKVIPDWPPPPSIREIWGFHDLTNFYKRFVPYFSILVAPLIELVRNHVPSWEDVHERGFQTLPYSNIPNTTNTYVFFIGVEGKSLEYEEPRDLRSNPFQGGGDDAILPPKGIG
ncbi:putative mitochondrial protein [Glycine soja]